jgi:hypothetical protein
MEEAHDKVETYEMYSMLRTGYQPRVVPLDYTEKAKFILRNIKKDLECVAASDLYNNGKKPNEHGYKYYGTTSDDYRDIVCDYGDLQNLFATTLKKHYQTFVEIFLNGLSLQDYATKCGKGKSTIDHRVNSLYADLAAEYERVSHIDKTAAKYPKFDELKPSQQKAIHDSINLFVAMGRARYETLVEKGANCIVDNENNLAENKGFTAMLRRLLD